jgi:ligand-binding sensor domain-containing protein
MKFILKKVILILLFCFAINAFSQQNNVSNGLAINNIGLHKTINYTSKNYEGHPKCYDAVQDNDGFMYFANFWGVIQFDGTKWKKIYLSNGSSCTSLIKNNTGDIYVGGRNDIGYLKSNDKGEKHFVSLRRYIKDVKAFGEVWQTYATPEGILFVSYEALFFKPYKKNRIKTLLKDIQSCFYVNNQIIVQKENKLWIYNNGKFKILSSNDFRSEITSIVPLKKDLLCASSNGLFIFDGHTFSKWESPVTKIFSQGFAKILKTDDNRLIFTIKQNGIIITDNNGNIISSLNKSSGLLTNTISGIYKDKEANLWATSNSGISYIPLSDEITYINDFLGISGTPYSSAEYNGYLYLATSDGLFRKKLTPSNLNFSRLFEKVKGINGVIWTLFAYDNKLFCGQGNAAYQIEDNKVKQIYNQGTWLFHPLEGLNLILIGTYRGLGILENKNGDWVYKNSIKGFDESSRYLVEDKYGDIWVSHGNKGVYQIRINKAFTQVTKIKQYNKNNGLPDNYDNNVFKINDKIIISGKMGVYFYDFETEKIKNYLPLTNILGKNVHLERIQQVSENLLWVMFNNGVLAKLETFIGYNYKTKLLTNKFENNTIQSFEHLNPINENLLLVGTQEGFSLLKKDKLLINSNLRFNTFINKVEIITSEPEIIWDGLSNTFNKLKNPIPYNKRSLRFSFTAPYYQDQQALNFQFFLTGFDDGKKWSGWTSNFYKEYTNLREGSYVFNLRARNSSGVISKVTRLEFEILPPWYRNKYAYLLYLILFISINYTIIKYLKKWHNKEKRKVELEKERNIREEQIKWEEAKLEDEKSIIKLKQEKLDIEAINLSKKEELLNIAKEKEREIFEIQQEKLETDISSKNNELTSLTIHITQKNEVLSNIKSSLHKAIKESSEKTTQINLSQIEHLIEKNLNSQKEWEKFSEHFDVVHEDFLKKLQKKYPDLKANSLRLCAYVKMKLSSKQISVLMNTEPESVTKARYRLRIKFNLVKEISLEEFLNDINFEQKI